MSDLFLGTGYRRLSVLGISARFRPRVVAIGAGLVGLLLATCAVLVTLGYSDVAADRTWVALLHPGEAAQDETLVIWTIRLPRLGLALVVGAALGLAGALLQSVTRNGLADPGLVGVGEGAAVSALALALLAPQVPLAVRPAAALVGGLAAAALVTVLARRVTGLRFVLIGVGVSWFLSSWIAVFIARASIEDAERALLWLSGSLNRASGPALLATLPWAVAGALIAAGTARASDAALLGDAPARGLGLHIERLGVVQVAASALLTAASVAAVGSLGFVGLIAPHVTRLLVGPGQAALFWGSALIGAGLVLAADAVGRLLFAPFQIPAGIVLAIIGSPLVLLLLWQRRDQL